MRLWFRLKRPIDKTQLATLNPIEVLRQSQLVDVAWYLDTYPDVASEGVDPVEHYFISGADEGRNPNALFDSYWYMENNIDVRDAKINPLLHFVTNGAKEYRSAGPKFNTACYLACNPDILESEMNPLLHYLLYGKDEGRILKPHDSDRYRSMSLDQQLITWIRFDAARQRYTTQQGPSRFQGA